MTKAIADLDAFSRGVVEDGLIERWLHAQRQHEARVRDLWAGTVARRFNDRELDILTELGYTSPADRALMNHVNNPGVAGRIAVTLGSTKGDPE